MISPIWLTQYKAENTTFQLQFHGQKDLNQPTLTPNQSMLMLQLVEKLLLLPQKRLN